MTCHFYGLNRLFELNCITFNHTLKVGLNETNERFSFFFKLFYNRNSFNRTTEYHFVKMYLSDYCNYKSKPSIFSREKNKCFMSLAFYSIFEFERKPKEKKLSGRQLFNFVTFFLFCSINHSLIKQTR